MRGPVFITLDLDEAHLAMLALDDEIKRIEPKISDPNYANIEGLPELLAKYVTLSDRLAAKLEARLGRKVGFR